MPKGTILIVDDIEMNRLILEDLIKGMGYSPLLAESGKEALALVEEAHPQLVLTDISMPGMDGYELCRILKAREDTKQIPVIFISAFDDPEDMVIGFTLGGADYITKPFVAEVVRARVGVHLRLYEASQELVETNRRLQASVSEQLRQMEAEKRDVLYALANIAAQNASYQQVYMERFTYNCRILAQGMQLSPLFEDQISDGYIDTMELAAPLCDIGNIGIPQEILQKQEELTPEERSVRQNHTELGARLLADLYVNNDYNDFIGMAVEVARFHHEHWDGSGYPQGLKGKEIPLSARIAAVAARYSELTENEAQDRDAAIEQLRQEAGSCFQPEIIQICCKIAKRLT
ncbi:MAG: response regulator [Lachnospiraceae bacterium]|jgi:putative two-component system response regulator|nr:response regulator [Lachnospiraceae bacterium]MCX4315156.1 response regulator [Lachnospiraceae bacterium]